MLRSKSSHRLSRGQQLRATLAELLLAHKLWLLWALGVVWVLYLGLSAARPPYRDSYRYTRSLLEASMVSGRLEALSLDQHPVGDLRAAVRTALSPDLGAWPAHGGQEEGLGEYDPLVKSVESLVAQLQAAEDVVPCSWDPTLEAGLRGLRGKKYLIAANFRDNEQLLPHALVQLWHLLAILPRGSTFLSVYESGSEDSTGAWLDVLRLVVNAMQVPHRIVIGGNLTRAEEQDRIEFLAQVRNAALEPLWLEHPSPERQEVSWFGEQPARPKRMWEADRVVFANDVFFCASDAVRLLLHDADMACGMDFDRKTLDQIPAEEQRYHLGQFLHHKMGLPVLVGELLGLLPPLLELQTHSAAANELFRRNQPLGFYDRWVGRDSNGAMFTKEQPYATDPFTLERLPWGLPFPVKCCWNGLVALNAAPFTRHGIRIRSHREGECAASECSLLCNDFLRLGYQDLLVDPGVRQAYTVRDARDLYQPQWVRGINVTSWAEVTSSPPVDPSLIPFRPYAQCCGLKPGNNMIDFETDCSWENFMYPNHTALPDVVRSPAINQSAAAEVSASAKKQRTLASGRKLTEHGREPI